MITDENIRQLKLCMFRHIKLTTIEVFGVIFILWWFCTVWAPSNSCLWVSVRTPVPLAFWGWGTILLNVPLCGAVIPIFSEFCGYRPSKFGSTFLVQIVVMFAPPGNNVRNRLFRGSFNSPLPRFRHGLFVFPAEWAQILVCILPFHRKNISSRCFFRIY